MDRVATYLVVDTLDDEPMFVSDDEQEADRVRDWYEHNTRVSSTLRGPRYSVRTIETYPSPFEDSWMRFRVTAVTFEDGKVNYWINRTSSRVMSVQYHRERWRGNETEHYAMVVAASDMDEARAKANTLLEPYGVVLR